MRHLLPQTTALFVHPPVNNTTGRLPTLVFIFLPRATFHRHLAARRHFLALWHLLLLRRRFLFYEKNNIFFSTAFHLQAAN